MLPPDAQVVSSTEQAAEDASDTNEFIKFLRIFLLVFGGVALFVGSFVIANSLSITIAQRTREFATLRTLGASRRQVLVSILLESLVVGTLAAITGLFLGLGLAKLLFWLFDLVGFTLPNQGLLFGTRTIVVSLLVGILVTVAREPAPGLPRDARPADRGRARGRDAAGLAVRALPRRRLPDARRARASPRCSGRSSARAGPARCCSSSASARCSSSSASPSSPRGSCGRSQRSSARSAPGSSCSVDLVWPLWTLPFWLFRVALWGPGSTGSASVRSRSGRASARHRRRSLPTSIVVRLVILASSSCCWSSPLAPAATRFTSWRPEWPIEFPSVLPDPTMNRVATQNSRRNPDRTASTASALMIGLALVTLVVAARRGAHLELRGRGRRHLHVGLRDHVAEQLQPDPDQRGRGRGEDAGRRGDRERPHRGGAASSTRRSS